MILCYDMIYYNIPLGEPKDASSHGTQRGDRRGPLQPIYLSLSLALPTYIYIYIERERETYIYRERERCLTAPNEEIHDSCKPPILRQKGCGNKVAEKRTI